jgi:iron complex outermembrane receptor protein
MNRSSLMRSVCVTVLLISTTTEFALAQQTLPPIEINKPQPRIRAKPQTASRQPSGTRRLERSGEPTRSVTPSPSTGPGLSGGEQQASGQSGGSSLPGGEQPGSSQSGAGLGGRFTGYNVNPETPALATKDGIPLNKMPANVQVVTRQAMDDRQDVTVRDAVVGWVSSVQPPSTTADSNNFYDGFNIRGFDNASIFRNDLRVFEVTNIETANLQSIEVLKGPAAMLFGRLEPGGVVNLVVKRPLETPYFSVQEQAGSWGMTRTTADATGPLTSDKTWLYRVNTDFTHTGSFLNQDVTLQNAFIGPTLTWHPIEQFRFNLDGEYQNTIFSDVANGVPALGNRPAPIPITTYVADPAVTVANPNRQQREFAGYDWTYDLAKDWSLTNRFSYTNTNYRQFETLTGNYSGLPFDPFTGLASFNLWDAFVDTRYIASNLDLKGKVETGPFEHQILVGVDFWKLEKNIEAYSGPNPTVGPLEVFAPFYANWGYVSSFSPLAGAYGIQPNMGGIVPNSYYPLRETWDGIYAQDMVSFLEDKIHVLLGGRYDWAWYGSGYSAYAMQDALTYYNPLTGGNFAVNTDRALSPRAGVVIQPVPWVSLYANYTRSIGLPNGISAPGAPPLPPEHGLQWEGGVKLELLEKRLTATLAYYDIFKSNILASVAGTPYSYPIGLAESKGVELDVAGRINEMWSLTASYSHDDARIRKGQAPDDFIFGETINIAGNVLQDVPRNAGSLWLKYDAQGDFKGLTLGGGIVAVGWRQGDNQNDFQLPAYARVDAMIAYRLPTAWAPGVKNLTVQLNVKNLANTTYYQNSSTYYNIFPGAPRTVFASIRVEY